MIQQSLGIPVHFKTNDGHTQPYNYYLLGVYNIITYYVFL